MVDFPLLSLMAFLPVVGILIILAIRGEEEIVAENTKHMALYTSLFTFAFALFMYTRFDGSSAEFQFVEHSRWLKPLGINYHVGVDGISIYFVLLVAFLTPVCMLSAWDLIQTRVKAFMIGFLALETFAIGTFIALDAVLFYVFFEGALIPIFLIIGVWGGTRRIFSAYRIFLYPLVGSALMFIGLLILYGETGTTDIPTLMDQPVAPQLQYWLWLAFFASFAIKTPMWPFHTWLPDTHEEAPTAVSVLLAGILLKIGGYGFLRFSLPMFPDASAYFTDLVFWLSVIAIVYSSLIALVQDDIKRLLAYSSVAHMGFVTLGIFTATTQGIEGGIFQMVSHGLIFGALFLCAGVLYDRLQTYEIERYGGIVKQMPKYAAVFMILMLGSIGLPGTSGFVGGFLILLGAFQVNTIVAALAALGLVFGAAYMLILYRGVVFGPRLNNDALSMPDLNTRELLLLLPFAVLILWLGLFPNTMINKISPSVDKLIGEYNAKVDGRWDGVLTDKEGAK